MDSNTPSKKEEEEDDKVSREATPRTSTSSNASDFVVQSPSVANAMSDTFLPSRHSIDELRDLHQLSRQALSRRLSTLSTTSSFGDIGDGNLNWNPREAGVNAISNVLSSVQSPSARQRVSKPTTREIPAVTLTNLPVVTYASFEPYLSSIGPDYERHRRFKKGLLEEHIRIGSKETSIVPASSFADLVDSKLLANISTSNLSVTSQDDTIHSPSVEPSPRPRRRNFEEEPESLDTVPSVFFDPTFSLSNPRTFDIVNEHSDLLARTGTGKPDRKSLATNAILQEKLSWYMDTVEIHLIKEINDASASFFAALSDLQELNEDASRCVARIARLREELGRIQDMHALQGVEAAKLHIKRANITRLQQVVDLVSKVATIKDQIEEHLEQKNVTKAFDLMQEIKAMMEQSESSAINLRRIDALRNIDAEMANVLSRIGTSQGNDLAKTLITDLRSWVNSTNTQATLRRLSETFNRDAPKRDLPNLSSPAHITVPNDVRKVVVQELQGLQQTRFLEQGMDLYRKEIVKEVKGVIKKNLPSVDDDTESVMSQFTQTQSSQSDRKDRSAALAKNLRQMAPEVFIEMITTTYASLAEFFRRLQTHQKLLLDLTALSGTVPADLSEVLSNIMDISSGRIQKILGVRAEQNSHLSPREFYVFLAATRLFSLECERISGKAPTVLTTTVNSQARGFVSWLHLDRVKLLGAAVDRDKWKSEDVLAVTQKQTSLLVQSATRDPPSWIQFIRVDSMENVNGVGSDTVEKTLAIEDEKFFIVGCVVVLLGILEEYCIALIALPSLQSDIASNLIELYNSRVMQVILRAGATKTAGLKSIMARHLAFASQALGAIISLIPYIREYARRHLGNSNPSVAEFDRTKRALQVHQDEIHTKLITIMDDRLKSHARTFDKLDWESVSEGRQVHPYAETVVTETSTLHNVLKRYLSPMVVEMIMDGVFASYISRLSDEYTKIETPSPKVKETMLADATYITEKLSELPGVRKMDRGLIQAVESREVTTSTAETSNENGTQKSLKEQAKDEVLFDVAQEEVEKPDDKGQ